MFSSTSHCLPDSMLQARNILRGASLTTSTHISSKGTTTEKRPSRLNCCCLLQRRRRRYIHTHNSSSERASVSQLINLPS